ncbi:hypothetical protein N657DRAFT_398930 [Parathielavia appendiculata]|uniref:Uncharacterized protein n=1 Tax=Parathielavia appendiculata TaxID=2587402 RepID=A0AAN6U1C5_9PEZI|nr:hypothetical protein N657DRAFT_398930 [Parathielavia appendiculata]
MGRSSRLERLRLVAIRRSVCGLLGIPGNGMHHVLAWEDRVLGSARLDGLDRESRDSRAAEGREIPVGQRGGGGAKASPRTVNG